MFLRLTVHLVLDNQLVVTSLGKTDSHSEQSLIIVALHQGMGPWKISLITVGILTIPLARGLPDNSSLMPPNLVTEVCEVFRSGNLP